MLLVYLKAHCISFFGTNVWRKYVRSKWLCISESSFADFRT